MPMRHDGASAWHVVSTVPFPSISEWISDGWTRPFRARLWKGKADMIRKAVLALAVSGLVLGAAACNTVRGVGQDIESAANAVDRAT